MALANNHAFFVLPPELHAHIFMLACSPSSAAGCTTASHYIAFFTGNALSLVSRYFNFTSAPARHRTVVLYGWRQIYAFDRILSKQTVGACAHSRTCYLTLIADDLPKDPASLLPEGSLSQRGLDKTRVELLLLNVVATILKMVGNDLYELEIGFQAIEHVRNPLAYLSLKGLLFFPRLEMIFFTSLFGSACPVSDETVSSTLAYLSCPHMKELTISCSSDSPLKTEVPLGVDVASQTLQVHRIQDLEMTVIDDISPSVSQVLASGNFEETQYTPYPKYFPSLTKLTILASTPAQALAALNVNESTWDVGCIFEIYGDSLFQDLPLKTQMTTHVWPLRARNLRTIVLIPKTRWNEKWESLRDVAKRQRETNKAACSKLDLFVLRPGKQLE
ncbi:hypothetical protein C8J55DRAFT_563434 [Lentinula edodes]|uniref:Uncharacterized protein n=1 Tax=Lentinula lateritia TaxID=40482 RepID=A0A9W9DI71_9AGAR|nr:hypothetical protein C8J55DRAFT_563434 [Lentinula edodes]